MGSIPKVKIINIVVEMETKNTVGATEMGVVEVAKLTTVVMGGLMEMVETIKNIRKEI